MNKHQKFTYLHNFWTKKAIGKANVSTLKRGQTERVREISFGLFFLIHSLQMTQGRVDPLMTKQWREKKEKEGPQTEHSFSEAKKVFQKMNCQKSLKLTFSYLLFLPEKTFK